MLNVDCDCGLERAVGFANFLNIIHNCHVTAELEQGQNCPERTKYLWMKEKFRILGIAVSLFAYQRLLCLKLELLS